MTEEEVEDLVEDMARDLYEGHGTRTWVNCTDQRYWHERARKLIERGWRKNP